MVFYKPITDRTEILKRFPNAHLPQNDVVGAYIAEEDGKISGECMVTVNGFSCTVSHLYAGDDALLAEGLLRAALHFAANRNAYTAVCCESKYRDVLLLLGFCEKDNVFSGEIPELLKGSCCK